MKVENNKIQKLNSSENIYNETGDIISSHIPTFMRDQTNSQYLWALQDIRNL